MGIGTCDCTEDAHRPDGSAVCVCDAPPSDVADSYVERFELFPKRGCRFVCKDGLKEVLGHKHSVCLSNAEYKAVVRAGETLKQGHCPDGSYEIPTPASKCIGQDHVENILA